MQELRHRGVNYLAKGHTAAEWGAGIEPRLSSSRTFASLDSRFVDRLERDTPQQLPTEGLSLVSPIPPCPGHSKGLAWSAELHGTGGNFWSVEGAGFLSLVPEHIHRPGDGAYHHFDPPPFELEGIFTVRPRLYGADMGTEAQKEVGTHLRSPGLICNTSVRFAAPCRPMTACGVLP